MGTLRKNIWHQSVCCDLLIVGVPACCSALLVWLFSKRGIWKVGATAWELFLNHRITECSGLEGTSVGHLVQPPLPKQGHLQQAVQDCVQAGLEYLQRGKLHNLPGQPVPGLHHPQREEILPHVQTKLPLLPFVPIAPCPDAGHHWKESGPILLTPTLKILIGIYKIPSQPSLLQVKQAQLPQPFLVGEMLQSPHRPCSPPLDSLQ